MLAPNEPWTKERLIAFEEEMKAAFAAGEIKAPLHLAGGNEDALIDYFRFNVHPDDWCLCSWRSHYHCLLKGVPHADVRKAILAGRSISLCFPDYRILSSAIVGGICPIAVGIAWAVLRKHEARRVHCFVGDMTARTGAYHEAWSYARGHRLPVTFVIEDNGLSVCTPTAWAWGDNTGSLIEAGVRGQPAKQVAYRYTLDRPHVGIGSWVSF
jgi:TPP-dependent pyruvate/acetoin dehydrogenase alpha subunit